MSEIKFRGKRINNGNWIYGYYVKDRLCAHLILPDKDWSKGSEVVPETVGQFTGLQDKNGVDIYEGDILAFERTKNFKKETILPFSVKWEDYGNGMVGWTQFSPIDMIVVIGNIHDNPALLAKNLAHPFGSNQDTAKEIFP